MSASSDDEMTWDAWLWVAAITLLGGAVAATALSGYAAILVWIVRRF
ncbi:hypothetical protein [Glutamicibacter nicotianae]|nr:hypothetical protein [Glutamicibacter nicotianae]WIV44509.1 hypothetical protein QQS42_02495 [Glutamicibacter nicotianae]